MAVTVFQNSIEFKDTSANNKATFNINDAGAREVAFAKAWVDFNGAGGNGSTIGYFGSGNVSNITDSGVGIYRINFIKPLLTDTMCIAGITDINFSSPPSYYNIGSLVYDTATKSQVSIRTYGNGAVDGRVSIAFFDIF